MLRTLLNSHVQVLGGAAVFNRRARDEGEAEPAVPAPSDSVPPQRIVFGSRANKHL
jgi:hypothetical protein